MGYLPASKHGDCSRCPRTNVDGRKRGKYFLCLQCCANDDRKAQIEKANKRDQLRRSPAPSVKSKVRGLLNTEENKTVKGSAELNRWFADRRNEMTGKCDNCGGASCKDNDEYFKFSIGHILPKNHFKSVATHPDNWLELCFFGNSCHTNLDNAQIDLIDLNCFDQVIKKFAKIYPHIAPDEKRRIPAILIEYLKTEI